MAIAQCRSRAQWPARLKQLSLNLLTGIKTRGWEMSKGDPKLATASSIIIGSRSRVTGKATASTKHNHMGMFGKTN
jgi:hypothetical protein